MGARRLSGLLVAAIATAVVAPSCSDPVHDQEVQALGPEDPSIPKGEYHRAGQPCTVCHGPEGPAQTTFSIAGTIFWNPLEGAGNTGAFGVNSATVSLVDATGSQVQISTNCVGNFWITPAAYNPNFPVLVAVGAAGAAGGSMFTPIGRAGSCATCHSDPPNYDAVGHVYVSTTPVPASLQNGNCPVDPNLEDEGTGGLP
jgi:mono/diheme cytochrome c family protein